VRGRARDVVPVELDRPLVLPYVPGEDVEQRRLPGAVRAGNSKDLGWTNLERDVVEDDEAAEVLPDPGAGENRSGQQSRAYFCQGAFW